MSDYLSIHLAVRPEPGPITQGLFQIKRQPIPEIGDSEVLIKQTHMSLDPAMIGWMSADRESYIPRVELGEVMRSIGIGVIVASNHPDFSPGNIVQGMLGWTEYKVSGGKGLNKIPPGSDPELILAVFALPGLTATQGLFGFANPKAGETIVVTGAAGSVGSLVGQLAKADGLHVIGVAGDDEKCQWITDVLGFDGAINYKTDDIASMLKELTPEGVDIFFENTGGPIQQQVFNRMNVHGRIIVCGMISDYVSAQPSPGPNWIPLIKKRVTVRGFAMTDHLGEASKLRAKLAPYVANGKIKFRTHVLEGLESAPEGLNLFFSGDNRGKLMVRL